MISNLIKYFEEMFFINKKDNALIGLYRLDKEKPPVKAVKKEKKNKEIKISQLMRGEGY